MAVLPVRRSAMLGESGFERGEGDRYWTEPWVTRALCKAGVLRRVPIWEPACGRGDMVDELRRQGYEVFASDIAGDEFGALCWDFQSTELPDSIAFGAIVTNPPYSLAEMFICRALGWTAARFGGQVAMLLRNEYDCAASRRRLFEGRPFAMKLVLMKRPKWVDDKAQSSASPRHNFAWFLWDWQWSGPAQIRYLP